MKESYGWALAALVLAHFEDAEWGNLADCRWCSDIDQCRVERGIPSIFD